MTTARLIRLGIGVGLTEVLANGGADVIPVGRGHGSGGGGEGGEEFSFELGFAGLVGLDESLDVVADGGVCAGGNLVLEVGGEAVGESDCDLHSGCLLGVGCLEFSGWCLGLGWWVAGWGFVVGLDVFKDFDCGDVGEAIFGFVSSDFIASDFVACGNVIACDVDGGAWG